MAFSPFDSAIFRDLYGDPEITKLFSDSAEVRAMLLVEGTLAKVQGELGVIPLDSALLIHRASLEIQIDPSGLGAGMGATGVPVPALVAEFRKAMEAPEHAQYVHWGATSQDIMDTALVLRLRQFIGIIEGRLAALIAELTMRAKENRDVVMAARTRSQIATPTTFGVKIAGWIAPLKRHQDRLHALRNRLLVVSLAGASGNYAALADKGQQVETALAEAFKLGAPDTPWHSARDNLVELASVLSGITATIGKLGQDVILLGQNEIAEVSFGSGGGSSTMPQKSNPVGAEVLVTMARYNAQNVGQIHSAGIHAQERDGAAWALEWLALPQICIATGVSLLHVQKLAENLRAHPDRMLANIATTKGQIMAEAAMFALSKHMRRPEAQELVKQACQSAFVDGLELREVLQSLTDAPLDWGAVFDPLNYTGLSGELVDAL